MATPPSFLVVSFPSQGHINPSLQFAKRLHRHGYSVSFLSATYAVHRITNFVPGISLLSYSDGYDDTGFMFNGNYESYMIESAERGSRALREMILARSDKGEGFACIFYTTVVPWVGHVTRSLGVRSVLLWAQPATVFDVYYYFFSGRKDEIMNVGRGQSKEMLLPGLPPLTSQDVPSFFTPGEKHTFGLKIMESHLENIMLEENPVVAVNTFDELEPDPLRAIEGVKLVAVGPLLPSAFTGGGDPSDKSFGGDLFESSRDYVCWLNTKEHGTVIYAAFGSLSTLSIPQMREVAKGLLGSGRPFLWVVRLEGKGVEGGGEGSVSFMEDMELEGKGMIVPWCSQLEVLSHPSVGCFLTHCGWNSTIEGLTCGVPMVAFPQWSDQQTNTKLVVDVWKVGVRLQMKEPGTVDADNIKDCLETILGDGEKREVIRRNAKKWKSLTREATQEGGSSDKNLWNLLQELITSPISKKG
ncbi:hypothetical protein MLD38_021442 [Melastoma candidum]|uniref:Uncharacterized protein n=1 Tax=Melastoma candidum TaxID=119954 RepID=A0ACB9QHY1_9MYRT|nr:hypothetical protein MLD38_021442 [Melastoma candidum]